MYMSNEFWFWAALPFVAIYAIATVWFAARREVGPALSMLSCALVAVFIGFSRQVDESVRQAMGVLILALSGIVVVMRRRSPPV